MKTYVYYHVAQMGNYEEVVAEQVDLIRASGLHEYVDEVRVGMLGPHHYLFPDKYRIVHRGADLEAAELPTLHRLWLDARDESFFALYMHTKGVSYAENAVSKEAMTGWRHYLEYFCIGQWRTCIELLKDRDTVGCQYFEKHPNHNAHYGGNFFWVNSAYIRGLCDVYDVPLNEHQPAERMKAEMWLGTNDDMRYHSLHFIDFDLYERPVTPEHYVR